MGSGGAFVDRTFLTMVENGEREISLERLSKNPETNGLFGGLSSAKILKMIGSTATFTHPASGEVSVTEVPATEGEKLFLR
jgi:hypothetical protein